MTSGKTGQLLLDFFEHFEMQSLRTGELERTVAGADGTRQRVDAGQAHKFLRLHRVGQFGVGLVHVDMFFHAAQLAEFRFHDDSLGMSRIDNTFGDFRVLFKGFVAGIDHHG